MDNKQAMDKALCEALDHTFSVKETASRGLFGAHGHDDHGDRSGHFMQHGHHYTLRPDYKSGLFTLVHTAGPKKGYAEIADVGKTRDPFSAMEMADKHAASLNEAAKNPLIGALTERMKPGKESAKQKAELKTSKKKEKIDVEPKLEESATSKKHYVSIAKILHDISKEDHGDKDVHMRAMNRVRSDLSDIFAKDNPHFDHERFHKASLPESVDALSESPSNYTHRKMLDDRWSAGRLSPKHIGAIRSEITKHGFDFSPYGELVNKSGKETGLHFAADSVEGKAGLIDTRHRNKDGSGAIYHEFRSPEHAAEVLKKLALHEDAINELDDKTLANYWAKAYDEYRRLHTAAKAGHEFHDKMLATKTGRKIPHAFEYLRTNADAEERKLEKRKQGSYLAWEKIAKHADDKLRGETVKEDVLREGYFATSTYNNLPADEYDHMIGETRKKIAGHLEDALAIEKAVIKSKTDKTHATFLPPEYRQHLNDVSHLEMFAHHLKAAKEYYHGKGPDSFGRIRLKKVGSKKTNETVVEDAKDGSTPVKFNIGTKKGRTREDIPLDDIRKSVEAHGFKIDRMRVKTRGGNEPTAIVSAHTHHAKSEVPDHIMAMSKELGQEAIAARHGKRGHLVGPKAADWGSKFIGKFFTENEDLITEALSRKTYVSIAKRLHDAMNDNDSIADMDDAQKQTYHNSVRGAAHALSDYFAKDNPRFDRDRFHKAAGVLDEADLSEAATLRGKRLQVKGSDGKWQWVFAHGRDRDEVVTTPRKKTALHPENNEAFFKNHFGSKEFRSAHDLEEDQLNELSPITLGRYIGYATADKSDAERKWGTSIATKSFQKTPEAKKELDDDAAKARRRADKRFDGILSARSKLVKKALKEQSIAAYLDEDTVRPGDRVHVQRDGEREWTGRVYKTGRDSAFSSVSAAAASHQVIPDPDHQSRLGSKPVSVLPKHVTRID